MTTQQIQQEIIDEFSAFDDWMDKYQMIIDLGNELPPLNPEFKTEDNLIEGCQSRVWLHAQFSNGLIHFEADSDAIITKGLIGLLIRVLSDHTPQEILDCDVHFIDEIGLTQHLSPTRSNGLLSMLKQIKTYALAYSQQ
ncbi:MAG: SufE family protein [Bacteroidaceae bacterium]|nr:SufE family protein [Bacteroidaceae bacterium]MBP5347817.1 SufE family protein [Bacteroidaceae bacterium]MBR4594617.1 SufE family protein [Bacteroidaceae bacterium]